MHIDLEVLAVRPDLIVQPPNVAIRCQIVRTIPAGVPTDAGPQSSERYIHLGLTVGDAMRLLGQLQEAQRTLGLPTPPQATLTAVPPDKGRH